MPSPGFPGSIPLRPIGVCAPWVPQARTSTTSTSPAARPHAPATSRLRISKRVLSLPQCALATCVPGRIMLATATLPSSQSPQSVQLDFLTSRRIRPESEELILAERKSRQAGVSAWRISAAPRSSMARIKSTISGGLMSLIGRSPIRGRMSDSIRCSVFAT